MNEDLAARREAERDERKRRIIEAAKKVFLEKGYFETGIRSIAKEARLSPGAIYYYYAGVDEIYVTICEESFSLINNALLEGAQRGKSSMQKLEGMTLSFLNYFLKHPEYTDLFVFSNIGWRRVGLQRELSERLERLLKESLSIVYQVLEEGKRRGEIRADEDTWRLVHSLWVTVEGAFCLERRGLLENSGFSLQQLIRTQLKILSSGIGTKK